MILAKYLKRESEIAVAPSIGQDHSARTKTPRSGERGVFASAGSIAAALAAAGPDQGVGRGAFVVEEVRVDRRIEARIVELDREIIAAVVGALRPGGPDLRFMWCTT